MNLLRQYLLVDPETCVRQADGTHGSTIETSRKKELFELLQKGNIHTVERLISARAEDLVELSKGQWSLHDIHFLKKWIAQNCCTPAFTLGEMYNHAKHFKEHISSGYAELDELLGKGFVTEELTEICGPSGSGKTQMLMTCAASLVLSYDCSVVYIDTCNCFKATRLRDIMIARTDGQIDLNSALSSVTYHKAFTVDQLGHILQRLVEAQEHSPPRRNAPLRLILIDSVTAIFSPIIGGKKTSLGYAAMMKIAHLLRVIAVRFGVTIVFSNATVSSDFNNNNIISSTQIHDQTQRVKPALGTSWESVPSVRVMVSKSQHSEQETVSKVLCATVLKSPRKTSMESITFKM